MFPSSHITSLSAVGDKVLSYWVGRGVVSNTKICIKWGKYRNLNRIIVYLKDVYSQQYSSAQLLCTPHPTHSKVNTLIVFEYILYVLNNRAGGGRQMCSSCFMFFIFQVLEKIFQSNMLPGYTTSYEECSYIANFLKPYRDPVHF